MSYEIKHEIIVSEEDLVAAIRLSHPEVPHTASIGLSMRGGYSAGGPTQYAVSWATYGHPCTTDPTPIKPKETE